MRQSKGLMAMVIILCVIIIDQVLKIWVKTSFYYGEEVEITSWFKLFFIENNGMAFGLEIINKLVLTIFRIIASIFFIYYIWKIRKAYIPAGYMCCLALITAGTIGNAIDCVFYGIIFNNPMPPEVASFMPESGGYASLFYGKVVDMLYFPLAQWTWPEWMPMIGGNHFIFFQPVFNIADAALSVGVIVMIIFYSKYLSTPIKQKEIKEEAE